MSDLDALLAQQASAPTQSLDQILQAQANSGANQPTPQAQPRSPIEPPSMLDNLLAKIPSGLVNNRVLTGIRGAVMGAADPMVGTAQLAANLPFVRDIETRPNNLNDVVLGNTGANKLGNVVNNAIVSKNQQYEAQRGPDAGFDWSRAAGNVASPANLVMAAKAPMAVSTIGRIAQGAAFGGAAGAMSPVENTNDFWRQKALQTGAGVAVGGIATPILGKITDIVSSRLAAQPNINVNNAIDSALADMGQSSRDIHPDQMQSLRDQVNAALANNKNVDPAALLRKADFDAVDIPALQGQLTRNSLQFANERNLRGVANVGEPLQNVFDNQNQALQRQVTGFGAGATEKYPAGNTLADALQSIDKKSQANVTSLYNSAKSSAGADLDIPLQGLAQDYAKIVNNYGDKVPSGVRNQFNDLGLNPGNPSNQLKTFTMTDADQLLKVINDNASNDPAINSALNALRASVKNSVNEVDASGGPFAPAVAAARQRFQTHDNTPALAAVIKGNVSPDDFVNKYVINGKTDQLQSMAKLLQNGGETDALNQAKSQVGDYLGRAAFGENTSGDKLFSPERFAKGLRDIGTDKLNIFYTPAEVNQLKTLSRVGSYINSTPSSAPVNSSNTGGMLANILMGGAKLIPGAKSVIGLAQAGKAAFDNKAAVAASVGATVPTISPAASEETKRLLAQLLASGAFSGSAVAAGATQGPSK